MTSRFRYSLRTFLLTLAIAMAVLGVWKTRSFEQQKHVRFLKGIGLDVTYDLEEGRRSGLIRGARVWLASRFGKDFVSVPIVMKASNSARTAVYTKDMMTLSKLRWLRSVDLSFMPIDDQDLEVIARLPQLEALTLSCTLISDKGLTTLDRCRSLKELSLGYTYVTPGAANSFASRHPGCRVERRGEEPSLNRHRGKLKPDRLLTPHEKGQLDAALRVFEENDIYIRDKLIQRIDGHGPESRLDPNAEPDPGDDFAWGFDIAILTLNMLGHADAIPTLERIARGASDTAILRETTFRERAIQALGNIADQRVIPILIDLLEDKDHWIAFQAWRYLNVMTGQPDSEDLIWRPDRDLENPIPTELVARWRQFWKENGDVLRPRRASNLGM